MDKKELQNPALYTNRELSWLLFNKRVLSEARDKQLLLFERLKFLSITASNLDEFFMVRIGSLVDMIHAEYTKKDIAGMSAKEQLDALMEETHKFAALQYSTYNRMLLPQLRANGLNFVEHHEQLTERQAQYVDEYFEENVYPVLTPMAVDSSRPFPLIRNKTLNIGALVAKKGEKDTEIEFATVQVPSVLPRVVRIPAAKEGDTEVAVLLLEEIIERNISKLFLNYNVLCAHPFRITRNADLAIDEDEAEDLLLEIEKQIKKRTWGQAIRLEIEAAADRRLLKILCRELSVRKEDVFEIDGPLDLTFLMKVYGLEGFDELRAPKYTPAPVPEFDGTDNIFDVIKKGDVLMHHPYQSFMPVVDFIRQASKDPDVLAIKQTLYRVSGNSPIIAALAQAAENGKQVSVLVELKARFDEENNIVWARKLEKAGCHVIYGLVGLKTHSKITLVVRKEEDGIRRSQRLLLTWLIENPELFDKIKGIITADDFVEDLYHQVAQMVFEGQASGNLNPAAILSHFINDEDQYKEVAALFNASLKESLNNEEQKKAFSETVMKVRKNSLDAASRNAKDITQLQEIIKQQAALKNLRISLD